MTPEIIVYSPLPPQRSGVADYVADQLIAFSKHCRVTAVIADRKAVNWGDGGIRVVAEAEFNREPPRPHVPRLYHLGNHLVHEFVYNAAVRTPGILVLHDFVLHHLVTGMTLRRGDAARYESMMTHDYGREGTLLAQQRSRGLFTADQQFLLPINGEVLTRSQGIVSHSRSVKARIENEWPGLPVHYSPLHVGELPNGFTLDSRAEARRRLGLPPDALIFMTLGFLTRPKQISNCLRALASLRSQIPPYYYVLAGQRSHGLDVDGETEALGLADVTRITGYIGTATYFDYLQACDIVFNLRYPSAGETSATLHQSLQMGRTAFLYDYGSYCDYPEDVCVRLPCAPDDDSSLAAAIKKWALDLESRRALERRAAAYARKWFDVDACAADVLGFVNRVQKSGRHGKAA